MKITKVQLRKIITEEVEATMREVWLRKIITEEVEATMIEAEGDTPLAGAGDEPMRKLLGQEYTRFVQYLGANIKDPKTQAIITAGVEGRDGSADDDAFGFAEVAIPVAQLIPTQNEIDINKSLAYPLNLQPAGFIDKVTSNGPFTIQDRIVTYNGKYVIDGHHRWSTVYACNKNASINAVDLRISDVKPLDVLKAVQMSIGIDTKNIPVSSVEGTNLLKIDRASLAAWIQKTASPELFQLIAQSSAVQKVLGGADSVNEIFGFSSAEKMDKAVAASAEELHMPLADYIWSNVAQMQKTSQPVPGAGPRDFMPQTDDADWKGSLARGEIDIKPPFAKNPQAVAKQEIAEIFSQLIKKK